MKSVFILPFLLIFYGCGNIIIPEPKPLHQDDSLETVKDIKLISDSISVAFEWKRSNYPNLAGYRIYRAKVLGDVSEELSLVATIEEPVATHYVDKELQSNTVYKYAFTTFTIDGRESKSSKVKIIKTRPAVSAPLYIHSIKDLANKTKLIWRPHTDKKVSGYIIERQDTNTGEWEVVGELEHRFEVEFIDLDLETNKIYKYRVFSKTFDGQTSRPSETVDAITKARPSGVAEIRATSDLPQEIRISWKNIAGNKYRIYQSASLDGEFVLIGETSKNNFSDKIEKNGVQRFYKVSSVDQTGLESALPDLPVSGITLFPPKAPKLIDVLVENGKVKVVWEATDNKSLKYFVERKSGSNWSGKDTVRFETAKTTFIDETAPTSGNLSYRVISIDRHGLLSKESNEKGLSKN
jgi:fibronectin type 3 domain-containing protein